MSGCPVFLVVCVTMLKKHGTAIIPYSLLGNVRGLLRFAGERFMTIHHAWL